MYQTDKEVITTDDIKEYLQDYVKEWVPHYQRLLDYYNGDNPTIMKKKSPDPNNPDNRTAISYAHKIVTTYVGYGYRPKYITYKSDNTAMLESLQTTFNETNEHIKTSQHGRNTAIYGISYELVYIAKNSKTGKADAKLAVFDPRNVFLIYSNDIEPVRRYGIRFYNMQGDEWKVIVYDDIYITTYSAEWKNNEIDLVLEGQEEHNIGAVPIIEFATPDKRGIFEVVLSLIDNYDLLISDSMNEFDRFAHAYLRLVNMSLSDQKKSASPNVFKSALALIKQRRVFEMLKSPDDVTFLTKDIPTDYIRFMTELIREQIHVQSHVPDFAKFNDLSGIAVQRLMFDFENVVSNAEAEFDIALYERIKLIARLHGLSSIPTGDPDEITISHKRNTPLNLKEFADTALVMNQAGFSKYLQADIMPDDIVPDVKEELNRQQEEQDAMIPDIEDVPQEVNEEPQGAELES